MMLLLAGSTILAIGIPILAALTAFLSGVVYVARKQEQRHSGSLQSLAERLGLQFHEKDMFGLFNQLKSFALFGRVRSKVRRSSGVKNVLRGVVGDTEVFQFEYSYVVSTGKTTTVITQTVFFAHNKDWFLPNFQLKPETWLDKVLSKIGLKSDINMPENPDFSKKIWLTGEYESLIRKMFDPAVQNFLLERPPVHIEGNNYYLIAYKPGKRLNDDEAEIFYENCLRLTQLLQREDKNMLLDLAELKPAEKVAQTRENA